MIVPYSEYPSYIPDEPVLLGEEEKKKQALAAIALEAAGARGREITEAGNVPLFTNIQQENRPVFTPETIYTPDSGLNNSVVVPDGTYQNEVVYVPQKTMQEFNPRGVPRKPPTPQEMTLMDKLVQSRDHVVKNILKYDPMDIDPGRDAMSAREYYLKNNPGDKNGADKAYTAALTDSSARKAAGLQILGSMEEAVKQQEMRLFTANEEQRRHERNLAEKRAEVGNIEPLGARLPVPASGDVQRAAIADLPPGQQNVVKKLVNYEIPLPSGMALRTPYWQGILERAASYDPSFDASQYNVRMALKRDFNSGKSAQNIRSLNTAIGHLDTLAEKAKALDNFNLPAWNWVENKRISAMGDKRVTGFLNAATAVESELAAVFKGMGATDQEIKQWRANLSENQSPAQLKESIGTAIELLSSRLGALQSQYETGLGKPKDFKFLSPKSEAILKKLGVDTSIIDTVPQARSNVPSVGTTSKGYRFKGGNPADKNNWEKM